METAATLRRVTEQAQRLDDLPDTLAVRIFAIADRLADVDADADDIQNLIAQIGEYDTYGQTGYLGMGVNHVILEKTIREVEARLAD